MCEQPLNILVWYFHNVIYSNQTLHLKYVVLACEQLSKSHNWQKQISTPAPYIFTCDMTTKALCSYFLYYMCQWYDTFSTKCLWPKTAKPLLNIENPPQTPDFIGPFQTYSVFHNDQMRIIFGFTNFNIIRSVTSVHIQISVFRLNYLNIFINRINNLGVNGHRYSRSWENKSLPMDERCLKTFHLYNTVAQAHSSQTQNKRQAACLRIPHRNQIFYPGKL